MMDINKVGIKYLAKILDSDQHVSSKYFNITCFQVLAILYNFCSKDFIKIYNYDLNLIPVGT